PIAVQSSLHFILHPSGLYFSDAGQFPAADLEKYVNTLVKDFNPRSVYVSDIQPKSCWICFVGQTMQAGERCTATFSRSVCVKQLPKGKLENAVEKLVLHPDIRYEVTDCKGDGR